MAYIREGSFRDSLELKANKLNLPECKGRKTSLFARRARAAAHSLRREDMWDILPRIDYRPI